MGFTALCSGIGPPGTWHTDACLRQPRGQPANTVTRAILKRKTHGPTAVQSAIAVSKLISSAEYRDIDKEMGFGTLYKSLWSLQQRKVRQPHKRSRLLKNAL